MYHTSECEVSYFLIQVRKQLPRPSAKINVWTQWLHSATLSEVAASAKSYSPKRQFGQNVCTCHRALLPLSLFLFQLVATPAIAIHDSVTHLVTSEYSVICRFCGGIL